MASGRFLLNKTMSRNGGTLICQLLEGHPQIFFPPFYFDVAISDPKCWPFAGIGQMSAEEFAEKIIRKCSAWQGSAWYDAENLPLKHDPRFRVELLDVPILREVSGGLVDDKNLEVALLSLFEDLVVIYGEAYQQACADAEYFVLDADHSFNCGVQHSQSRFRGMSFLQSIRNVFDVVASRKNMLLHHNGVFGNPRDFTLRKEVVEAEVTRWIWSVMSAVKHIDEAPGRCLTVQFESLHRNRSLVMRQVAAFLGIDYNPSLLVEGLKHVNSIDGKDSQFLSSSSLLRLTRGSKSSVVGSAHDTLNTQEWEHASTVLGQGVLNWPEVIDASGFKDYLHELGQSQMNNWLQNQRIALMAKQSNCRRVMEIYSSMNFGRREAARAFE